MTMRTLAAACLATTCLAAAVPACAAPADDYAYAWPLQTQGDSAAFQVELTPEVYAAVTRADLRDIEVVNAAGEAVPLAPRAAPSAAVALETQVALPIFPLPEPAAQKDGDDEFIRLHVERGADGRLRSLDAQTRANPSAAEAHAPTANQRDLILDASALRDSLSSLQILWDGTGQSISAQFAVSTSDDLQKWRSVVASASVLHLEQNGNVLERHGVTLDGTRATYLRLRRLDDGPPLRDLRVFGRLHTHANAESAGVQWLAASVDGSDVRYLSRALAPADGKHNVAWRYHLPAPLAVEAIRIALADDNSLARIVAISRERDPYDDPAAWQQRGVYVAFRLRQDGTVVDNDDFTAVPSRRASEWRLESATALEHAPALSVAYRPDRFVFLAQGGGPYRLVAGSARAQRGDYPIDTALAPLRAKLGADWQPPLATLGARATLRGEDALKPAPAAPPVRDWRSWLLWAVLVGAAALIGGLALSLLRKPEAGKGP